MPSVKRATEQNQSHRNKTRQRQAHSPLPKGQAPAISPVTVLQQSLDSSATAPFNPAEMLVLQRAIGNRAVQSLLDWRPASVAPPAVVQAKLKGTYDAVAAMTASDSGEIASAAEHSRFHTSRWLKIVSALADYEDVEQQVLDILPALAGNPAQLKKALQPLASRLEAIIKNVQNWQQSGTHQKEIAAKNEQALKRAHALRFLLPRLRLELSDIKTGRYLETSVSGQLTTAAGGEAAVGGALNVLDKVVTAEGERGFFREEKATEESEWPKVIGMNAQAPNLGARAVAMYRLDRLLEVGAIVKTEFATHGQHKRIVGGENKVVGIERGPTIQKQGIYMEAAKGEQASTAASTLSLADLQGAGIQRGLVKLQMLDALAGQIDRHMGNYFIQKDPTGRVIGVQGIDNDLSFGTVLADPTGKNIVHPGRARGPGVQMFRGLPPVVDEPLAGRFLALKENDVRQVLEPLLGQAEVDATLARLQIIKQDLTQMKQEGLFIKANQWGAQTLEKLGTGSESYIGGIKGGLEYDHLEALIPPGTPNRQGLVEMISKFKTAKALSWPEAQDLARDGPGLLAAGGKSYPKELVMRWIVAHGSVGQQIKGFLANAGFNGKQDEAAYYIISHVVDLMHRTAPWLDLAACEKVAQRLPKDLTDPKAIRVAVSAQGEIVKQQMSPRHQAIGAALMKNHFAEVIKQNPAVDKDVLFSEVKGSVADQIWAGGLIEKQGLELARRVPTLLLRTPYANWSKEIIKLAHSVQLDTPFYRAIEAALMASGFDQVIAQSVNEYKDPLFEAKKLIANTVGADFSEAQALQVARNAATNFRGRAIDDWYAPIAGLVKHFKGQAAKTGVAAPGAPAG